MLIRAIYRESNPILGFHRVPHFGASPVRTGFTAGFVVSFHRRSISSLTAPRMGSERKMAGEGAFRHHRHRVVSFWYEVSPNLTAPKLKKLTRRIPTGVFTRSTSELLPGKCREGRIRTCDLVLLRRSNSMSHCRIKIGFTQRIMGRDLASTLVDAIQDLNLIIR